MKKLYALLVVTIVFLSTSPSSFSGTSLFPSALRTSEWLTFDAAGFSKPVCGVVYRKDNLITNGMPLGGIDTGCIDLETSGLLGYCTIFNTLVPRRGPLNVPILGISVGGKTWVLCDKQIKKGKGPYQLEVEPGLTELELEGVETVKDIRYWGHYPVADLEFETTAPVSVGLRAWSPFLPGDVKGSMIPGIVFEVHLRNTSGSAQKGALAFSFPGPTANEAGTSKFERKDIRGKLAGVEIGCANMSYALGVIDGKKVRFGGELGADGSAWANIEKALPGSQPDKAGASSAVDFSLAPGQEEVVRFVLTWHAPTWEGGGFNWVKSPVEGTPIVPTIGYTPMGNIFHHMYAKYYPNAAKTAQLLADQHAALLERILAWQQVVYTAKELPIWLRESLVNVLHLITECALWAQARAPIPSWATEDEGLFGLNECPRGCPQIECIPCSFYGNQPLVYFYPKLALSTLRGYKNYMAPSGAAPFIFGGTNNFTTPTSDYHATANGVCLASLVDRYLLCHGTPDKKLAKEFYPAIKKNVEFTINLTPEQPIGERIISVGVIKPAIEWFETPEPGWFGMTAHIAGLHLAQIRIAERLARQVGDDAFAQQCGEWIRAGTEARERNLWTGSYYLNFWEKSTGKRSELVFGYQLDGEWIERHHGVATTLPRENLKKTLETIKRCNIALTKFGAVNYANADGTACDPGGYGAYGFFPPEALMLAMNYMYEGEVKFGLELARKVWHNIVCLQGYPWDMPNIMRGDKDTGERSYGNDYYQDMMLWSLPAALEQKDFSAPIQTGGLVDRVLRAAAK